MQFPQEQPISPANLQYLQVNGQTLAYFQSKPYPKRYEVTFLFLHNNLGCLFSWKEIILELYERHVVALDMRGFGKSTYRRPVESLEDLARDVREFCLLKKLSKVTVVGWGFGGLVAMKLAEIAQVLVKELILVCSYGPQGKWASSYHGEEIKTKEQISKFPEHRRYEKIIKDLNSQLLREIYEMTLFRGLERVSEARKLELVEAAFLQRHYLETVAMIANPQINLTEIKAQLRFYVGDEDPITPASSLERMLQSLDDRKLSYSLVEFECCGHFLPVQYFEKLGSSLRDIWQFR